MVRDGLELGRIMQRVEDSEEAFARNGEDPVAAVDQQLVDQSEKQPDDRL